MQHTPNVLKRWYERGNAIAEYMPTLTLIGAFSIAILIVVGRDVGRTYEEVNCGVANASGEVIECPPEEGDAEETQSANPDLNPTEDPNPDEPPECPADLDFDGLPAGAVVTNQFDGVTISAVANNNAVDQAMIFDSGNVTGSDFDLGTPNEDFGGPGIGPGGAAGQPGENNTALGNVLIISEDGDSTDPDDNQYGGVLTFAFTNPADLSYVHVLDQDTDDEAEISLFGAENALIETQVVPTPGNGDNGVFRVDFDRTGIHRMEVNLPGSGAIASVFFCE